MAGPEGRKLDLIGLKDIHYTETDGKIVKTERSSEWWPKVFETINKFDPSPELDQPIMSAPALDSLAKAVEYAKEDTSVIIPADLIPQWDAMISLYNEYSSDIIRGIKPISAFDEFVEKWNKAGGDDFSDYLEEQLK